MLPSNMGSLENTNLFCTDWSDATIQTLPGHFAQSL